MKNRIHREYQVINLVMEYGGELSGFKYAIASYLPEKELRFKYKKELARYEPFLYLTGDQGEAIMESIRNNKKFLKRRIDHDDIYGYEDGIMDMHHEDVHILQGDSIRAENEDPLSILISREEYLEEQKILNERLEVLEKAMASLTERQLRRVRMAYIEDLTEAEISRREKVDIAAVHRSMVGAEKKLRKILKKKYKNLS